MAEISTSLLPASDRNFYRAVRWLSRSANVAAIIIVPLVLSVWLTVADRSAIWPGLYWGITAIVALTQIALFFLTTQFSETSPELHTHLQEERAIQEALNGALQIQHETIEWLEASRALSVFWSTSQGLLTHIPHGSDDDLAYMCGIIVNPMISLAKTLFGFEFDDVWSTAVYRFETAENMLRPIWFERSESHPSTGLPRAWQPGDGHVGSAFLQERILFTTDATSEEASPLLKPSVANEREHDAQVYRSFVSAPISLDAEQETLRFGVLVLTSHVAGRFDEENERIVGHAAQVLAHAFDVNRLAGVPA